MTQQPKRLHWFVFTFFPPPVFSFLSFRLEMSPEEMSEKCAASHSAWTKPVYFFLRFLSLCEQTNHVNICAATSSAVTQAQTDTDTHKEMYRLSIHAFTVQANKGSHEYTRTHSQCDRERATSGLTSTCKAPM